MTPLTQQLEDKKKGCGKKFGARDERIQEPFICGTKQGEITIKCPQCRAEIAILEQAIAEIKKRDKDIDELAESSTFALCALMKENKELKDEIKKQRQEEIDFLKEFDWTLKDLKFNGHQELIKDEKEGCFTCNKIRKAEVEISDRIKSIQSHIYRGNSSKEKDNQRVPISESATDEVTTDGKAHHQILLQKQRQEILDRNLEIADMLDDMFINFSTMDYSKKGDTWTILKQDWNKCIKELKQQLNQPKTEE